MVICDVTPYARPTAAVIDVNFRSSTNFEKETVEDRKSSLVVQNTIQPSRSNRLPTSPAGCRNHGWRLGPTAGILAVENILI